MKKKIIGLVLFWLGCVGSVVGQVTGKAFLYGQTDHSGIKVKFVGQSPTAKTDSVYTAIDGGYSAPIISGTYKIEVSKETFETVSYEQGNTIFINGQTFLKSETLFPKTNYLSGILSNRRLAQGITYIINGDITIPSEDSLVIEQGARILVDGVYGINVQGSIYTRGRENDSVSIISKNFGKKWKGIDLSTSDAKAEFLYTKFVNATTLIHDTRSWGAFNQSIPPIKLSNCFIKGSEKVVESLTGAIITNNHIEDCFGIYYGGMQTFSDGNREVIVTCNNIRLSNANTDYTALMYIAYGAKRMIFKNNVVKANENIVEDHYADFSSFVEFEIANNLFLNSSEYHIRLPLKREDSRPYRIYKNTFDGGKCALVEHSCCTEIYNNIFNSDFAYGLAPESGTNNDLRPFNNNIFGKSAYVEKSILGFGQKLATNANGDSVDTYYNLFQDPEFLNGKPPYLALGSPAIGAGIDDQGNPTNIGFDPTGTCLEGYFTKEPPIVSADTNSISGIVHQGGSYMTDGVVVAINKSNNKTYISRIKADGVFKADSLSKGNYILYAVPNPATTTNYVPTFYVNKTDINQAVTLPLQWKIIDVDIYLAQKTGTEVGTSKINGRFGYGDSNTDDTTAYAKSWFGSYPTPAGPIALTGNPCKNLPILLYNNSGQVVSSTISDTDGYFQFDQLAAGEYKVNGQRNGYITENNGRVQLTSGQTETTSFYMVKREVLGLEETEWNNGSNTTAYPNPFKEEINILGFRGQVLVTDLTGSTYYSNSTFANEPISTEGWPSGIYLLKTGDKVQKIIKQ